MKRPLAWVAAQLKAGLAAGQGTELGPSAEVTGWSTDSRTVEPGDLFIALRGPNHDGNQHVAGALAKGAVAAIADGEVDGETGHEAAAGPVIRVPDSLAALQTLARVARREWAGQVVAVTGSAGKTTAKDVIAEMVAVGRTAEKTQGNLNNHIGLPLSLLRLNEAAEVAVLELGMNHSGEIRDLAAICNPDVGVVTNVGWAHIEYFESIDGIAAAKRELVESLGPGGVALLNADDERVAAFAASHGGRTVLFGQSSAADVRAERVTYSEQGVRFEVRGVPFQSPMTGRHGVSNLLAGIAVAGLYGIAPESLQEVAKQLQPGKMRGERIRHGGILVYNDCYNSNPDAACAMLDVLKDTPARKRIAVLGEMLELGRWAEPLHRRVGDYAARSGLDVLVGIRGVACHMLDAAKRAGLRADAAFFFEDAASAGQFLRTIAEPGDAVLFKGSRGVHVEAALEMFLREHGDGGAAILPAGEERN